MTMFRNMDKDSSGLIDKREFMKAMQSMGIVSASGEELQALWDEARWNDRTLLLQRARLPSVALSNTCLHRATV